MDDYDLELTAIDAEQRIDYEFYQKKYRDLEEQLKGYPTLDKLAFDIRSGFRTFKKENATPFQRDPINYELFDYTREQKDFFAPFIGIDNLSPVGCITGPVFLLRLDDKPTISTATGDEIIMAAITSRSKKEGTSKIGRSAIIERGEEYYVNQTFAIISPRPNIDVYFLQFSLGEDYFIEQINRYAKPSSKFQECITLGDLKRMRIKTYDEEKMNKYGNRHKKRMKIYRDLLWTQFCDRNRLRDEAYTGRRVEIEFPEDRQWPDLKRISPSDMDDTLRKLLYGEDEPKMPDQVVTPEITKKPKMQGRKVEF